MINTSCSGFSPTPGPWKVRGSNKYLAVSTDPSVTDCGIVKIHDCRMVAVVNECTEDEMAANAALIAEAGTVFHETGKTPGQLARENAALLAALKGEMRPTLAAELKVARETGGKTLTRLVEENAAMLKVLKEFIQDCEAVGFDYVKEDWPDLLVTVEHAIEAVAGTEAK